jgi:hypothetical protein
MLHARELENLGEGLAVGAARFRGDAFIDDGNGCVHDRLQCESFASTAKA